MPAKLSPVTANESFQTENRMLRNSKAFTLIELMVVIVIIGILATLAIPKFNEASVKAKVSEAPTVLSSYDNAALAYLAETNLLEESITSLAIANPVNLDSKYYTYSHEAGGHLAATAAPSGMGDVNDLSIITSLNTKGQITHTAEAAYTKYVPNWEHTTD